MRGWHKAAAARCPLCAAMPGSAGAPRCAHAPSAPTERTEFAACFPLPCCSAPTITAQLTGSTTAGVAITPPAGGPWSEYAVTLCPIGGGSACITTKCTTPSSCPVGGLTPETTYVTTVCREPACPVACPPARPPSCPLACPLACPLTCPLTCLYLACMHAGMQACLPACLPTCLPAYMPVCLLIVACLQAHTQGRTTAHTT